MQIYEENLIFFSQCMDWTLPVLTLGGWRVIGVAPWFSLPALASAVRSRNVNAASVVSTQPLTMVVKRVNVYYVLTQ
jgi:hypothetical protein